MGVLYSISESKFIPLEQCDYDSLLKNCSSFKSYDKLFFAGYNFEIAEIPKTATFSDYAALIANNFGEVIIAKKYSSTFFIALNLSFLFTAAVLYFYGHAAQSLILILVLLVLNALFYEKTPQSTVSWESLQSNLWSLKNQRSQLSRSSILTSINSMPDLSQFVETEIDGIKSFVENSIEYMLVAPNTIVPLHKHSSRVFAKAIENGLEYKTQGKWNPLMKDQFVYIGANVNHSLRNLTKESILLISTADYSSALQDFHRV